MKKTLMCLTAVTWLWIAKGQERGLPQRQIAQSQKTQKVISFKSEDRSTENKVNELLNPGKNYSFKKIKSKQDAAHQLVTDVYEQYYQGIRVEGSEMRMVKLNGKTQYVIQDYAEINTTINTKPRLTDKQALNEIFEKYAAKSYAWEDPEREKALKERKKDPAASYYPKAELVILPEQDQLAYKFEIFATDPWTREEVFVSAQTGEIVKKNNLMTRENNLSHLNQAPKIISPPTGGNLAFAELVAQFSPLVSERTLGGVFDDQTNQFYLNNRGLKIHTQRINGVSGSTPAPPIKEFATAENYYGLGDFRNATGDVFQGVKMHFALENIHTYFLSKFNRLGYDGSYSPISAYIYPKQLTGAFYDREETLFFPYDNGIYKPEIKVFPHFQTAYHEYAHAFTVSESGLINSQESASLNEGLSDIWAYTVADDYLKQHPWGPNDIDVLLYKALYGNQWLTIAGNEEFQAHYEEINGYSVIRDAKDPKKYKYPAFYKGEYWNSQITDEHVNSTVISHWYYLLSEGASVSPENAPGTVINIAGIGIENAAKMIYLTTTNFLGSGTNYNSFALRTILAAKIIFGENAPEVQSTIAAWEAVGIGQLNFDSGLACTPPDNYTTPYFIQKFEMANIQTSKPKDFTGGYRDYGFLTISGKAGYTYDLYLKAGGSKELPKTLYWTIWIDINGDKNFDLTENVFSAQSNTNIAIDGEINLVKGQVTLPTLLKPDSPSFMRLVVSSDPNASPCYTPMADKSPKYIEDYSIAINEHCPIINWTNTDFEKGNEGFNGLNYDKISLIECGDIPIFNVSPVLGQKLIDQNQQKLTAGKIYNLTFSFKPTGTEAVPSGWNGQSSLGSCDNYTPSGFSLGWFDEKAKHMGEESGGAGPGYVSPGTCPDLAKEPDAKAEYTICPKNFNNFVWVDFNRNGVFEFNEKFKAVFNSENNSFFVHFKVPDWATTQEGETDIRIYSYLGNPAMSGGNACGEATNNLIKIFDGNPVISKNGMDIKIGLNKDDNQFKMMDPVAEAPAEESSLSIAPKSSAEVFNEPGGLNLYPNPASTQVSLSLPKGIDTSRFTLELYHAEGGLLLSKAWDGGFLDISRYPSGMYIITLKREGESYSQKLLIQK